MVRCLPFLVSRKRFNRSSKRAASSSVCHIAQKKFDVLPLQIHVFSVSSDACFSQY
jgi:hypothetical protein